MQKSASTSIHSTVTHLDLRVAHWALPPYRGSEVHVPGKGQPATSPILLKDTPQPYPQSFPPLIFAINLTNPLLSQPRFPVRATALFSLIFLAKLLKELSIFAFSSSSPSILF